MSPSAGDPLSLNRYAYCVGDPVNASDPSGAITDVEEGAFSYYYRDSHGDRGCARTASFLVRFPRSVYRGGAAGQRKRADWVRQLEFERFHINIGVSIPGRPAGGVIVNVFGIKDPASERAYRDGRGSEAFDHMQNSLSKFDLPGSGNSGLTAVNYVRYVSGGLGMGGHWMIGEGWVEPLHLGASATVAAGIAGVSKDYSAPGLEYGPGMEISTGLYLTSPVHEMPWE